MDAPTQVGGVNRLLRDPKCCVVMDVGGDDIGARAVGGYAPALNREKTAVYYIVNAYRPWSCDIEHIDGTLSKILQVTHLQLPKLRFVANPNNGLFTTRQEYEAGLAKTREMLDPYCTMEFAAIYQPLHAGEEEPDDLPVLPLELHLRYPWLQGRKFPALKDKYLSFRIRKEVSWYGKGRCNCRAVQKLPVFASSLPQECSGSGN